MGSLARKNALSIFGTVVLGWSSRASVSEDDSISWNSPYLHGTSDIFLLE